MNAHRIAPLLLLVACAEKSSSSAPTLKVRVQRLAEPVTPTIGAEFSGTLRAAEASAVSFEYPGTIASVEVDEGDEVTAGQVLAKLDTDRVDAELNQAKARVDQARARLRLANATLKRQRKLAESNFASEQRLDDTLSSARQARSALRLAKAAVKAATVRRDKATLYAPYDGVITRRHQDPGEIATGGRPVLSLLAAGRLEAVVGVSSSFAKKMKVGDQASLEWRGHRDSVKLIGVTPRRERGSRSVELIFETELTPKEANVGDAVVLDGVRGAAESGHWVPVDALHAAQRGLWAVYVVEPKSETNGSSARGVIRRRVVSSLYHQGERTLVKGALEPGDLMVVEGVHRLMPGLPVRYDEGERQ